MKQINSGLEYDELRYVEKNLWKSLNGNARNEKDLIGTINLEKYKFTMENGMMHITNMNAVTHPHIMERIKLLFLTAIKHGMPKDMCYCIITEYLNYLNGITHQIAIKLEDKAIKRFSNRGCIGVTGPTGPVGCAGPVGPVGCDGARGERGPKDERGTIGCVGPRGDRGDSGYDCKPRKSDCGYKGSSKKCYSDCGYKKSCS